MLLVNQHIGFGSGASGTTPDKVANLWAWFRGDLGVTGDPTVTAWADQSGGSRDLDTVTATPQLLTGGGPNGQDAIEFDGTERLKDGSQPTGTLPIHTFCILRVGTYVNLDIVWNLGLNTDPDAAPRLIMDATQLVAASGGGLNISNSPSAGTWALVETTHAANDFMTAAVNGGAYDSAATGAIATASGLAIGARSGTFGNPADVDVAEFVVYENGVLSASTRQALLQYFNQRYRLF